LLFFFIQASFLQPLMLLHQTSGLIRRGMYISNDFTCQPRPPLESSNPSPMASRCLQSDLTNGVVGPCISRP